MIYLTAYNSSILQEGRTFRGLGLKDKSLIVKIVPDDVFVRILAENHEPYATSQHPSGKSEFWEGRVSHHSQRIKSISLAEERDQPRWQ